MNPSTMYWLMMLDNIRNTFECLLVLSIISTGILIAIGCCEEIKSLFKYAKISAIAACIGVLGITFLPNTKQMAAIIIVPKVVNSEFANETLPAEAKELYSLAKTWLVAKSKGKE